MNLLQDGDGLGAVGYRAAVRTADTRIVLLFAVVVTVGLALLGPPAAAGGVSGTVLAAGRVVAVSTPGTTMTVPADGRLRGDNFGATVTGVAWPAMAGPSPQYVAGFGHRLVVFSLQLIQAVADVGPNASPVTTATAWVSVSGTTLPVDLTQIDNSIAASFDKTGSGVGVYVVSVPATDHDVSLEINAENFSQSLSLWTLQRSDPQAPILYRDPDSTTVTAPQTGAATATLTNPADGFSVPTSLSIATATLSAFSPDTPPKVAPPGQAFLTLIFNSTGPDYGPGGPAYDDFIGLLAPLSGSDVTLTIPGGTPQPAQVVQVPGNQPTDFTSTGMLDGYYFSYTVPEPFTAGTVTVAASTTPGSEGQHLTDTTPATIAVSGPSTLPVTMPPVPTTAVQPTPVWVGAPLPPTGSSATGSGTGAGSSAIGTGSGGGLPVWLAVVLVVILAGVVVGVQRVLRGRKTGATVPAADLSPDPDRTPKVTAEPSNGPEPMVVRVLGPVEVTGWLNHPDRKIVEELCCFLALHQDRPVTSDQLLVGVWPTAEDGVGRRAVWACGWGEVTRWVGTAGGHRGVVLVSRASRTARTVGFGWTDRTGCNTNSPSPPAGLAATLKR